MNSILFLVFALFSVCSAETIKSWGEIDNFAHSIAARILIRGESNASRTEFLTFPHVMISFSSFIEIIF